MCGVWRCFESVFGFGCDYGLLYIYMERARAVLVGDEVGRVLEK